MALLGGISPLQLSDPPGVQLSNPSKNFIAYDLPPVQIEAVILISFMKMFHRDVHDCLLASINCFKLATSAVCPFAWALSFAFSLLAASKVDQAISAGYHSFWPASSKHSPRIWKVDFLLYFIILNSKKPNPRLILGMLHPKGLDDLINSGTSAFSFFTSTSTSALAAFWLYFLFSLYVLLMSIWVLKKKPCEWPCRVRLVSSMSPELQVSTQDEYLSVQYL